MHGKRSERLACHVAYVQAKQRVEEVAEEKARKRAPPRTRINAGDPAVNGKALRRATRINMLAILLSLPSFLNFPSLTPPTPRDVFKAVDQAVYAADRQRDELLSSVKKAVLQKDGLADLTEFSIARGATVVVTGATDGIGKEAALYLAKEGFGVVLCARDEAKGNRAAADIQAEVSDARVQVVPCDLASVKSTEAAAPLVVAAAEELGAPLRGLILNAGIWPGSLQITEDGMELGLQACHVGHFQLCTKLLPMLADGLSANEESRVVTVSSSAHAFASTAGLDDPTWKDASFDASFNYARAKFANMLFAQELAANRAPAGVRSVAAHPGVVLTTLFKELGPNYEAGTGLSSGGSPTGRSAVGDRLAGIPALRTLQEQTPLGLVLKSPREGSRPIVHALLAPGLANGAYVVDCEVRDIAPASKSVAARRELWEWTSRWLEEKVALLGPEEDATSAEEVNDTCETDEECGLPSD